jgi:hypothetical protein
MRAGSTASRAFRKASPVAKRAALSFSSAFRMIDSSSGEIAAFMKVGRGGASSIWERRISSVFVEVKGRRPVHIRNRSTPTA